MLESELVRASECWLYWHVGRYDGGVFFDSLWHGGVLCVLVGVASSMRF